MNSSCHDRVLEGVMDSGGDAQLSSVHAVLGAELSSIVEPDGTEGIDNGGGRGRCDSQLESRALVYR